MRRHQILGLALASLVTGGFHPASAQSIPASAVACHFVIRAYLNIGADGQGVAASACHVLRSMKGALVRG